MSHFLRASEVREQYLGKPRAAVKVRVVGRDILRVEPGISVVRADARIAPVPERMRVQDPEGETIEPSKGSAFFVTTESFDPYHLVMELPNSWEFR